MEEEVVVEEEEEMVEEEEKVEEEDIDLCSPIAWCINAWKPINIINFCLDSSREHEQLAVED